jgi:hypothetical protein
MSKQSKVTQFPDSKISSNFLLKHLAIFKIPYLLEFWELDCPCHPDGSAGFVDHLEALLV